MAGEIRHTAHIPEWKVKDVAELVDMISKSRVVGVVGVREIPASNMQQLRGSLRENIEIRMVRNTIARRALMESAPEIRPLADFIDETMAILAQVPTPPFIGVKRLAFLSQAEAEGRYEATFARLNGL